MLQLNQIVLLAADDWIQLLGGIIFMALYGLQQFLTGRGEEKAKPKKPPRPKQPVGQPEVGQQAAEMRPADQADPLRAEVDQFLRQAEQKQKPERETRPAPRTPHAEGERPRTIDSSERKRRRSEPPRRKPKKADKGPELRREKVGQHVERHLSTKEYEQRAKHLGEEVALADDKLEARLEKTFEHRLGKLDQNEGQSQQNSETAAATSTIAEEIRQLLSQPQGMRQVIVANEILRRPEERW